MEIEERKCSICGKNRECIKFTSAIEIFLDKTFDAYICKECHKRIREKEEEDLNETYKHEYFW